MGGDARQLSRGRSAAQHHPTRHFATDRPARARTGRQAPEPGSPRRVADTERPAIDGLCGKADWPAIGDDGGGRRALGDARRIASRRRRNHRAHLVVAAGQERQHGSSQSLSGDRGRHHAEPYRPPAGAGNRARLSAGTIVGFRGSQPRPVRLSYRRSRQPLPRPRRWSIEAARSSQVSNHHVSAQVPAFRDRALAVQPARSAAGPTASQRFACNRHPHGDRGIGHCRDPHVDRRERTGGRPASAFVDRIENPAADVFCKLARFTRHAGRRTGRRSSRQESAAIVDAPRRARH